jgi:hypothetical protein
LCPSGPPAGPACEAAAGPASQTPGPPKDPMQRDIQRNKHGLTGPMPRRPSDEPTTRCRRPSDAGAAIRRPLEDDIDIVRGSGVYVLTVLQEHATTPGPTPSSGSPSSSTPNRASHPPAPPPSRSALPRPALAVRRHSAPEPFDTGRPPSAGARYDARVVGGGWMPQPQRGASPIARAYIHHHRHGSRSFKNARTS